jgi:hypothetical protein
MRTDTIRMSNAWITTPDDIPNDGKLIASQIRERTRRVRSAENSYQRGDAVWLRRYRNSGTR